MTFNSLYPLIQELVFGSSYRIYIILEWEERKFLGRNLPNLMEDVGITIDNCSLREWDICVEGYKKYIYYIMPNNFNIGVSNLNHESKLLDMRGS